MLFFFAGFGASFGVIKINYLINHLKKKNVVPEAYFQEDINLQQRNTYVMELFVSLNRSASNLCVYASVCLFVGAFSIFNGCQMRA